jgi:hypothetical protein
MYIVELLPKDFPEMSLLDQVDALIDVYGMTILLTGNNQYKDNIEMLEECKKECIRRKSSFNMFDLIDKEFTKEDFRKMKSQSILMKTQ